MKTKGHMYMYVIILLSMPGYQNYYKCLSIQKLPSMHADCRPQNYKNNR